MHGTWNLVTDSFGTYFAHVFIPADVDLEVGRVDLSDLPAFAPKTEADLLRDGFGEAPLFHVLLAEDDGDPAGFAFYFFPYSTWTGRPKARSRCATR